VNKITDGHLEARPDRHQQEWSGRVDAACGELMRGVLHHQAFQQLEAAWRGLAMLVERLDTDGQLKIHVFDATLDELNTDPEGTHALFARKDNPWGVIIGAFVFDQTDGESRRARQLAQVARAAGTPFIAEATPPSGEPSAEWQALRRSPEAKWLGLAVPRFLLRLPYGRQTSPIDTFAFEEMPRQNHSGYLWGNPAFCCAYLLGLAFLSEGWSMRPGVVREVGSLPLHTYVEDGDTVAKPCAEVLLSEHDAKFIMDQGLMALASMKDGDSALLVRFQSVTEPVSALAGRWSGA
jgi:type VI secretion system protein ImpC